MHHLPTHSWFCCLPTYPSITPPPRSPLFCLMHANLVCMHPFQMCFVLLGTLTLTYANKIGCTYSSFGYICLIYKGCIYICLMAPYATLLKRLCLMNLFIFLSPLFSCQVLLGLQHLAPPACIFLRII